MEPVGFLCPLQERLSSCCKINVPLTFLLVLKPSQQKKAWEQEQK